MLFALECLKQIDKAGLKFKVVGEIYDEAYYSKCKSLSSELKNIQVEFVGALTPDEFQAELRNSHLTFLPTLGENYGHAIYEAMANARPVLISDQTPWRNLENSKAGYDLDLNNKSNFVEAISTFLMMNNEEYQIWCSGASSYVKKNVDFEKIREEYLQLFR